MAGDDFTRDLIAWQNQVVADRELTLLAFHVAYVIGQHLNRERGDAWPSQVRIAEILQVNERSVRNAVEQLRSRGHLSVTVRHGRGDSNRYRTILKNRNEDSGLSAENRNGGSGIEPENRNADAGLNQRNRNGRSKETGTSVPPNYLKEPSERGDSPPTPYDFDEFWDTYPLKVDRDKAYQQYIRIIRARKATANEIIAGARLYAEARAGEDPKYTKEPKNWLMDGRWKDPPRHRNPGSASSAAKQTRQPQSAAEVIMARRARRMSHG